MDEALRFRNVKEEPARQRSTQRQVLADKRGASSVVQRLLDQQTQAANRRRNLGRPRRADQSGQITRPARYSPFDGFAARVARSRDAASTR